MFEDKSDAEQIKKTLASCEVDLLLKEIGKYDCFIDAILSESISLSGDNLASNSTVFCIDLITQTMVHNFQRAASFWKVVSHLLRIIESNSSSLVVEHTIADLLTLLITISVTDESEILQLSESFLALIKLKGQSHHSHIALAIKIFVIKNAHFTKI
eukprot:TRINITY_DN4775_c0_g1_i2.p2 TRINITY_DN4775_c0_g1~~TRINITY_DN4775_c0_g1_i2.p2  ORF type:complete len:157 (-),score=14.98 TRINITY_DN4775_c0_g1_i2:449-919(-)